MNKFLVISLIFILTGINTCAFAAGMSTQMFYVPSLATTNMNQNISELTNDAMLYNFNFADELNLIQKDTTDYHDLKKKNNKNTNSPNTLKNETLHNYQQQIDTHENFEDDKNNTLVK